MSISISLAISVSLSTQGPSWISFLDPPKSVGLGERHGPVSAVVGGVRARRSREGGARRRCGCLRRCRGGGLLTDVYVYIYMYIYAHMGKYVYVYIYICLCVNIYMYAYVFIYGIRLRLHYLHPDAARHE